MINWMVCDDLSDLERSFSAIVIPLHINLIFMCTVIITMYNSWTPEADAACPSLDPLLDPVPSP